MDKRFIDAEFCEAQAGLSQHQIQQWQGQGFTFVRGLIPQVLVSALIDIASDLFPSGGSEAAEHKRGFGSSGALVFPSSYFEFNEVTLHPNLLVVICQLLELDIHEIRLTQSDLWPKYGRVATGSLRDNSDQRMHVDYPNHCLTHPPIWQQPDAVELILYLSDYQDCAGSTALVPRNDDQDPAYRWPIIDSPGIAGKDFINDRSQAERYMAGISPGLGDWRSGLYAREQYVAYRPGDIFFYRHDTWHRGTPLHLGARRFVQNMTFRKASSEWIGNLHPGWAWAAYRQDQSMERWIATCTVDQRTLLGFPQPGHEYWNHDLIMAVQARYGPHGFDAGPYLEQLKQ